MGDVSNITSKWFQVGRRINKIISLLSKFNERFIKSYNEDGDKGYFLEVDVEYPKDLSNFHKDLPFLPER